MKPIVGITGARMRESTDVAASPPASALDAALVSPSRTAAKVATNAATLLHPEFHLLALAPVVDPSTTSLVRLNVRADDYAYASALQASKPLAVNSVGLRSVAMVPFQRPVDAVWMNAAPCAHVRTYHGGRRSGPRLVMERPSDWHAIQHWYAAPVAAPDSCARGEVGAPPSPTTHTLDSIPDFDSTLGLRQLARGSHVPGAVHLAVSIDVAPGRFYRSKIVTIAPRAVLINASGFAVEYRQGEYHHQLARPLAPVCVLPTCARDAAPAFDASVAATAAAFTCTPATSAENALAAGGEVNERQHWTELHQPLEASSSSSSQGSEDTHGALSFRFLRCPLSDAGMLPGSAAPMWAWSAHYPVFAGSHTIKLRPYLFGPHA
ncbi:MAG: hypothetical protein EOO41_04880, partial [Methanobacteriota archaeon]